MTKEIELRDCPFCGGKVRITDAYESFHESQTVWNRKFAGYYISCSTPNCIRFTSKFRILDKGLFAWNRRKQSHIEEGEKR